MTHRGGGGRSIRNPALGRVEGEGGLRLTLDSDGVRDVHLDIFEPPRFFEAFLRGRAHTEPPDITARICGICPVAYQMSACLAIEDACGVEVTGPIDDLRRLVYWGEWIESHALHIHLLHAPDFLGVPSGIALAELDREAVERGLALKQAGNDLVELVGGRPIHPVNVRVGGWYRVPRARELRTLLDPLRVARDRALEVVEWVAGFERPSLEVEHEVLALHDGTSYAVLHGRVASDGGLDLASSDLEHRVVEHQVRHSTALHARTSTGGRYLVGPMARFRLNHGLLGSLAREAADAAGLDPAGRNPFDSVVVRAVETLHACDEAVALIERYVEPDVAAVPVEPRAGVGHGVTEAPRGLLYHRYELDDDGTILDARIIPPTSQNQAAIEEDLRRLAERHLDATDDELQQLCEHAIRNHDPCISCATHFLDLVVDRR
ncbi:MAG: Ni/Fe hydrogenase subunit alpha [Actinomycetota bacterium]